MKPCRAVPDAALGKPGALPCRVERVARFYPFSLTSRALPLWVAGLLLCLAWPVCPLLRAGSEVLEDDDYLISLWSAETGMPAVASPLITQAPEGFLWLVGKEGLLRFDGVRWRLLGNFIPGYRDAFLFADPREGIWIAPPDGSLWRERHGTLHKTIEPQSPGERIILMRPTATREAMLALSATGRLIEIGSGPIPRPLLAPDLNDPTVDLMVQGSDALWLRTRAGTVRLMKGAEVHPMDLKHLSARDLKCDARGTLWVATQRGVFFGDAPPFQILPPSPEAGPFEATAVFPAAGGKDRVWVRAHQQLFLHEAGLWRIALPQWPPSPAPVTAEFTDRQGNQWSATDGEGIFVATPQGVLRRVRLPSQLANNRIRSISEDRAGNIWALAHGGVLARFRLRRFHVYTPASGLSDPATRAVREDAGGTLWTGVASGGLDAFKEGQWRHYPLGNDRPETAAIALWSSRNGRLWAGTADDGVYLYEDDRFVSAFDPELIGREARVLCEDARGRLWIGNRQGLFCFFQGTLTPHGPDEGLPAGPVTALELDAQGTLWVGTGAGLARQQNGGTFALVGETRKLPNTAITAIHSQNEDTLWIATGDGYLCRWRAGALNRAPAARLPTHQISGLVTDGIGTLWCMTQSGLLAISVAELDSVFGGKSAKLDYRTFSKADGLQAERCSPGIAPAGWRARDGRLWISTEGGLLVFRPDSLNRDSVPPVVLVEELTATGKDRTTRFDLPGHLEQSSQAQFSEKPLTIPQGQRRLDFRFTAPDPGSPEKTHFRYRLEGLDAQWTEAGTERIASYTHVPPGDYRFRVLARNGDGVLNAVGATIPLQVVPFFYETRWFLALAGTAALGLVAAAVRFMVRINYRRRLRVLEQEKALERERSRISQDIHDDLGASLSQIGFLSALATRNNAKPEDMRMHAQRIHEKSVEVTRALDEIVWAINPRNDSIRQLITYLAQCAGEMIAGSPSAFRLEIEEPLLDGALSAEARHHLFLASKEALHNAARHSAAREIRLQVSSSPDGIRIVVQDNGTGFERSTLDGSGNGLWGMERRLREIGGECQMESSPGNGSTVTFLLPRSASSFP